MYLKLCIYLILVTYVSAAAKVVCYYESWASYRNVNPENFDANLCTHVNYAFIGLWDNGNLKVSDDHLDIDQKLYKRVTDMKQKNPNLKVLLSVGGGAAGASQLFASIAGDAAKRGPFIGSTTYFLSTYNFDGLDVDWEVPSTADKQNYITLLRELRASFNQHGWLLTAAVAANPAPGYDVGQMIGLLDWFNIMSYDFYGPWSSYTGQNSALYASSVESSWEKQNLNMAACSNNWVKAGVPKNKLVLGIAFYGRSFTLANANVHGIHAPITKAAGVGGGSLTYVDICQNYNNGWTRIWDDQQKNPYKYSGDNWFSYDDKDSVRAKGDFIRNNGFAGAMIWAIDGDDVFGKCGPKQQLLKEVHSGLGN